MIAPVILRGTERAVRRPVTQEHHGFIASHVAMATHATTMAHHTTGVTCFELPLRGESLAAWLNS